MVTDRNLSLSKRPYLALETASDRWRHTKFCMVYHCFVLIWPSISSNVLPLRVAEKDTSQNRERALLYTIQRSKTVVIKSAKRLVIDE